MIRSTGREIQERQGRDRSRRVVLLIVGIVLLSLGDLLITVTFLRSTGLSEANAIAAFLIRETGSVAALVAYKTLTVLVCVGLLYRLRKLVEGEVAAWCAMLILAVTAAQWYQYTSQLDGISEMQLVRSSGAARDGWLVID